MQEMRSKITAKVEGGKLLRMEMELTESGERLKSIKITGDFFIHPEDSLQIVEKTLLMAGIGDGADKIAASITDISKSQGIQMLGITPEALARAFLECVKLAREVKVPAVTSLDGGPQDVNS
ncbi:MAG TPA: hypothetical protein VJI13_03205 [Candidatus Norongarragalinales archaeon]|nr:hypothetical protein [Candidatus Norongarragalinales archaeon]